ncbi:MAG TPA: ATP-dependent DNA helicase RecG [Xanthomonadaceae bacterium]|nr:ATP-dependent DNA helicase RecG [Xanthomonadaceae bacterium]
MGRAPRRKPPAPALAGGGEAPLTTLAGVGPGVAKKLAVQGLLRVQDLWFHLPLRYEDRTRLSAIRALQTGVPAQAEGRVEAVERSFRFRPMLQVALGDDSGASLVLRFFHFTSAQVAQFAVGRRMRVYGTPREGRGGLEIAHPSYKFLADDDAQELGDRLDPVYPAIEGIGAGALRRLIGLALQGLPPAAELELLPAAALRAQQLPGLREALLTMHQPAVGTDTLQLAAGVHPAQKRLALEELLAYQLSLRRQRMAIRRLGALPIMAQDDLADALRKRLGFVPTAAQERVLGEIHADIARDEPMLRLLQGDVGSGKTVVAALAALRAIAAGRQVALMAPTELLAEQHCATFRTWLEPLGVRVAWLAGKLVARTRREALAAIADGSAQIVIGTHALMQEGVAFADLGLAVVDEQHRFGVHQRLALRDKGRNGERVPHQLVMTATPIPRTLAMTAYADLDVSVIDELPPGRTPVQTVAASVERRGELIERIRVACAEGRQAYWVCTLIDESDEVQAQSATNLHKQLAEQLPGLRVGFVHGRMKPAEKQATMRAFKEGAVDLLVATTVIEVGVDVPRASLMLIENAERLGLAQLHQLRGRVGRGAEVSSCVLLYQPPLSAMARERIDTMRRTTDGFVIAQKDLDLRGPGELLGTRQTGLAQFRVADLMRDAALLPQVQMLADALLAQDPARAERVIARWVGGAERYAGV